MMINDFDIRELPSRKLFEGSKMILLLSRVFNLDPLSISIGFGSVLTGEPALLLQSQASKSWVFHIELIDIIGCSFGIRMPCSLYSCLNIGLTLWVFANPTIVGSIGDLPEH